MQGQRKIVGTILEVSENSIPHLVVSHGLDRFSVNLDESTLVRRGYHKVDFADLKPGLVIFASGRERGERVMFADTIEIREDQAF